MGCRKLDQRLRSRRNIRTTVLRASASNKDNGHSSIRRPEEDEQQWPTLKNVRSTISTITKRRAQEMRSTFTSLVTVPGGRPGQKILATMKKGDLALVIHDPVSGVSYLQGLELATLSKEMVYSKGLRPLLGLDCCHSGAVLRDGQRDDDQHQQGKIREAVYNAEIDRQSSRWDLNLILYFRHRPAISNSFWT